jgi:CRP-like cAMP-binding protein
MEQHELGHAAAWPLWLARQPEAVRQTMVDAMTRREAAAGEVLVPAHGGDTGLIGVLQGQVALELHDQGGARRLVDLRTAGFWCGRASPIRPTPDALAVVVHRPSRIVAIEPARVAAMIEADPKLLVCFADLMAAHAQVFTTYFDVVVARDPTARIARKIIACAGAQRGARIEATQLELAEMTNASRNTVNRVLIGLERDGAVRLGYAYVLVDDVAALRRAAGFPAADAGVARLDAAAARDLRAAGAADGEAPTSLAPTGSLPGRRAG